MISDEQRKGLRTWLEIDTAKLDSNIQEIKKFVGSDVKLCTVVKSNAYGHGLVGFSNEIADKVDYFAVDSLVEGTRLRKEGVTKPIIVLGYTLPELFNSAAEHDISITISSIDQLKEIENFQSSKPLELHIKIDTGLHRQGFGKPEKEKLFKQLENLSEKISVAGVYTHFVQAKNPDDRELTNTQIKEFESWKKDFIDTGFSPIFHTSATASSFLYPETNNDMVRIGIGLYGYYPSKEVSDHISKKVNLQPILSWRTIISEIKKIKKGESVGYNHEWTAKKDSAIAIVPTGYWHGLKRSLSNKGSVLVKDSKVSIIGAISMDMIIIDVTDISNIRIGDVVTIIGNSGNSDQYADSFEKSLDNHSDYEFLTTINPLIKKFYI